MSRELKAESLQGEVEFDQLPILAGRYREYEKKALELRRFAGLNTQERLDPFKLAETLRLKVVYLSEINELSDGARNHLKSVGHWSGGITKALADGTRVIIINDNQSPKRQAATLMEEICHALLGHEPTVISGKGRSYDKAVEDEAYGVGAAALVPYIALSSALARGEPVSQIAIRFGVTKALVEYRMRVLGLWVGTVVT